MVQIKSVAVHELNLCAEVVRKSFQTVALDFGFTVENNPGNAAFITVEKLQRDYNRGIMMFGQFDSNQLVGFVAIEKRSNYLYYLEKLSVIPERRHEGLGRKILDFVKKLVKELGGKKISIAIIEQNVQLKTWYQINGFISVGTQQFKHLNFVVGYMECDVR